MRQRAGEPSRLKGLLHPEHEVSFNGPYVGRHVKTGAGHEHSVNLIQSILEVVNREHDQNVNPVPAEKINERRKRKPRPRWLEHRQKNDAKRQRRDHPSQIDALHFNPSC